MDYEKTTFICRSDFNKYMKIDGATSKDVFEYFFDIRVGRFLSEKEKRYLHDLFEKWDQEHLENDKDFNDGLEDNVGEEACRILRMTSLVHINRSEKLAPACDSLSSVKSVK